MQRHEFGLLGVLPDDQRRSDTARSDVSNREAQTHGRPSTMGVLSAVEHHRQRISATIRRTQNNGPDIHSTDHSFQPSAPSASSAARSERWYDAMPGSDKTAPLDVAALLAQTISSSATVAEPGEGQTVRLPDIRLGSGASETDAIASTLTYSPTITQAAGEPAGSFGETSPYDFSMSGITVTPSGGTYTVAATVDNPITYQVRTTTGPDGQIDIDSDTDADIDSGNYTTVVSDLTPDITDLKGRPPRTKFFAKDLTVRHERFHCTDGETHAQSGVNLAQAWLDSQAAGSVGAVNTLLAQVPARVIATRQAAMTYPGREERAYADGVAEYRTRATAIKTKGDAGKYPAPTGAPKGAGLSRGAKVAIGVGGGALVGAGIGAFGGPMGALIGAGIGALVGLVGGLLA
jgi:hypothetical protein